MQFTDEDLDAGVAAGALPAEAAESFRAFVAGRRSTPAADEESFRLLTGFNDIFVSIALVMSLIALGWLAALLAAPAVGASVAVASWALAEYFTRVRRMALPSILLLFAFVGGAAQAAFVLFVMGKPDSHAVGELLGVGVVGAVAAFAHWARFMVPVTVAAGVLAFGGAAIAALAAYMQSTDAALYAILVAGLTTFAFALVWDTSDRERKTRRADVAFWLHLLAAPAIVHPAFSLLGLSNLSLFGLLEPDNVSSSAGAAPIAFALYAVLGVVALIVDRRALMVSSLAYLLLAMNSVFRATGALSTSVALSALVVGVGLLLLSAFWGAARRGVLRLTPQVWRERLPAAA